MEPPERQGSFFEGPCQPCLKNEKPQEESRSRLWDRALESTEWESLASVEKCKKASAVGEGWAKGTGAQCRVGEEDGTI